MGNGETGVDCGGGGCPACPGSTCGGNHASCGDLACPHPFVGTQTIDEWPTTVLTGGFNATSGVKLRDGWYGLVQQPQKGTMADEIVGLGSAGLYKAVLVENNGTKATVQWLPQYWTTP